MIAVAGLYDAVDFVDEAPGSDAAENGASALVSQSAGISALCALALEAVASGTTERGPDIEDVAAAASRLMFKCWNDLAVAANLIV